MTLHCRQTLTSQYSCREDCPSMCLLAHWLIDWLTAGVDPGWQIDLLMVNVDPDVG